LIILGGEVEGLILKIDNVTKIYGKDETKVVAIDNISFNVEKGEFISILGTSGSGKSTLLYMIGGLEIPTNGRVFIDGKNIFDMSDDMAVSFRREHIGFVFQNFNLISMLNVYENIVLPIRLANKKENKTFIHDIMNRIGIEDKKLSYPNQLSGGQQQRVAIARAIASKPNIILADEPTGNLDSKTESEVMKLLVELCEEYNQTILMITHNENLAKMAKRIIFIEDGKIKHVEE